MSKALKKKQVLLGQFDIGGSGSQVLDGGGVVNWVSNDRLCLKSFW